MSVYPEQRFQCDRCETQVNVPMVSTPGGPRAAGPADWLMLNIGAELTTPPSHLCPHCAEAFKNFMDAMHAPPRESQGPDAATGRGHGD